LSLAMGGAKVAVMSNPTDDILEYLLEPPPEPQTAAERTRAWRERKRLEGKPDNKAVDAAIAEATSYLMSRATTWPVLVDAEEMVKVATICLIRDGYRRKHARNLVVDRLRPREIHDSSSHMPSRQPHANALVVEQPLGGGRWKDEDIELVRALAGRTYSRPG
jgi:hypothetical protein